MKILLAQFNPIIGNLTYNYNKIWTSLEHFHDKCDIAVYPELSLTGYPPLDLINNPNFVTDQILYLNLLVKKSKKFNCVIIVGFVDINPNVEGKRFRNSLCVIEKGKIICSYAKRLLPTYDIFDEQRYFEPGSFPRYVNIKGKNVGLLICEDSWADDGKIYHSNPVDDLMQNQNIDIIISINASPSSLGKIQKRISIVESICHRYKKPFVYVNQVGANDDIVFDGSSFVMNSKGKLIKHLSSFKEEFEIVDLESRRAELRLWLVTKEEIMYNHVLLGIKDYVRKCGFKKVVVGSSGGIDSALTLAMATDALGKENVEAITMPSSYSSKGSIDDSVVLCKNLGIFLHEIAIKDMYDIFFEQFDAQFHPYKDSLAEQNTQARIRGMILMAFSNRYGNLVLSTGNKSEVAVGYCTLYGDMAGGLAPISDLYKMEVYQLSKYYNKLHKKEIIPQAILNKEPSAELAPGQKDRDNLPTYPVLDTILQYYIESDRSQIIRYHKFDTIFKDNLELQKKICRMVDRAEYKRRQAPPAIRIHEKAWGAGRRLPIAQQYKGIE